jgi:hypothetical protein
MPQLLGYLGFFCLVYNFLLVLNSWLLILGSLLKSANSFGQSGQNIGGLVSWGEALEILQKGWLMRM